jgi:hypothetical protein
MSRRQFFSRKLKKKVFEIKMKWAGSSALLHTPPFGIKFLEAASGQSYKTFSLS